MMNASPEVLDIEGEPRLVIRREKEGFVTRNLRTDPINIMGWCTKLLKAWQPDSLWI